jgi:hypothetical protein
VELAQALGQVETVRPDAVVTDRDALDPPATIQDPQPGGERLTDLALRVVERASDGGGGQ